MSELRSRVGAAIERNPIFLAAFAGVLAILVSLQMLKTPAGDGSGLSAGVEVGSLLLIAVLLSVGVIKWK